MPRFMRPLCFLFLAPAALWAGPLDIPLSFGDENSYREIPKKDFVSGVLPEGWQDESYWNKVGCVYSCQKEDGKTFLRIVCPPAEKPRMQFFHLLSEFGERKAFRVVFRARSTHKAEIRLNLQVTGSSRVYAACAAKTEETWKEFTNTMAGGPTDAKNIALIVYANGPGTLDLTDFSMTEIPLAEYLPATCVPVARLENKGWLERFQRDDRQLAEQKPDFVIMGDSITAGWEGQGKEAWEKYFAPNGARFGVSGDRVEHLLWRVENSCLGKACRPKLVTVLIGVNNLFSADAIDIAAGMKTLIAAIVRRSPETKVLILGVFPVGEKASDVRRNLIKAVNAQYEKLADGNRVSYLYFGDTFLDPDGSISKETLYDFVHCTPKSYMVYAEKLAPTVRALMVK